MKVVFAPSFRRAVDSVLRDAHSARIVVTIHINYRDVSNLQMHLYFNGSTYLSFIYMRPSHSENG